MDNLSLTGSKSSKYLNAKYLSFVPLCLLLVLLFDVLLLRKGLPIDFAIRSDFYQYFFPLTNLGIDMISHGDLPLWNPFIFSGMPLVSSLELGFFYPLNWIHLLFPTDHSFNILVFLHVFLAFLFTYFYCRHRGMSISASVLPGMAYGFSGAMTLHLWAGHMSMIYTMPWLPAILLSLDKCFEKRTLLRMLALTGCLACQFLAGFPMFTLAIALIIIPYVCVFGFDFRSGWKTKKNYTLLLLLIGTVVFSFALVSIQFFVSFDFMNQSHRGVLDYSTATTFSFPIQNLITFIIPDFFGNQITTMYWGQKFIWEGIAFCGIISILFCIFSFADIKNRFVIFWIAIGCIMMGIALGRYSFLYDIAYHTLPGLHLFRAVSKLCFFAIYAISILAGIGLDIILRNEKKTYEKFIRIVLWVAISAGLMGGGISFLGLLGFITPPESLSSLLQWMQENRWTNYSFTLAEIHLFAFDAFHCLLKSMLLSSLSILAAGLSVFLFRYKQPDYIRLLPLIILSILMVELYQYDIRYIKRSKAHPFSSVQTKVGRMLSSDTSLWRISALAPTMEFLNRFVHERIYDVGGYENAVLTRYDLFVKAMTGRTSSWKNIHLKIPYDEKVYDMLNVKYVMQLLATEDTHQDERKGEIVKYGLFHREHALDRAFIIHQAAVVDSIDDALDRLPELIAVGAETGTVIESTEKLSLVPVDDVEKEQEHVDIISYEPNEIRMFAELVKPGCMIVSDNFYPGWTAWVDGEKRDILPANLFMRAIQLDAGRHTIVMKFMPASFKYGAIISGMACMVYILMLMLVGIKFLVSRNTEED